MKTQRKFRPFFVVIILCLTFFSCKKTGTETTKEQTVKEGYSQNGSHQQNVLRYNRPTDAVKIFSKTIDVPPGKGVGKPSNNTSTAGRGPCNYTFSGTLEYAIYSLPCGTLNMPSGYPTNEYRIDFTFYMNTIGSSLPNLQNDFLILNGVTLSNPGDYSYSSGVPPTSQNPNGDGFTFTGSIWFSNLGINLPIGCGQSTTSMIFQGHCWSPLCSPGDDYFITINNISLKPSDACAANSEPAIVYPNVSPNQGEFYVFMPWDGACFETCFLPDDWTDLEIEYYKDPGGTHYNVLTGYVPFTYGPYIVSVLDGPGNYSIRSRYKCPGGGSGAWSTWSSVPVY